MDAFEVMQTSLGPALQALEQGGRDRLRLALTENQRRYDESRDESERSHNRMIREEERGYVERREQRVRSERKADAKEERLRGLVAEVRGLGGKVDGTETEEDLMAMLPDLKLARKVKETEALDNASILLKARHLKIPTDGVPIGDLVEAIAKKEQNNKTDLQFAEIESKVSKARSNPDYETVRMNLAAEEFRRQADLQAAKEQAPIQMNDLSPESKAALGQRFMLDSRFRNLVTKMPGGAILAENISQGKIGALDQAYARAQTLPDADKLAFQDATMQFAQTAGGLARAEDAADLQMFVKHLQTLPYKIRSSDERIQAMLADPVFGPALSRENRANLIKEYSQKFAESMPGAPTAGKKAKPSGPTALPGDVPTPKLGASSLSPVSQVAGPPVPDVPGVDYGMFNQILAAERAAVPPGGALFTEGAPLNKNYLDFLGRSVGLTPKPIGSSVLMRSPGSQLLKSPESLEALNQITPEQSDVIAQTVFERYWNSITPAEQQRLRERSKLPLPSASSLYR